MTLEAGHVMFQEWDSNGKIPSFQRREARVCSGDHPLEMMIVIAIMGIMTAIALPRVSDAVRKARSQADAVQFKSVLTHARYLARSTLRCTLVQVQRNTAADKEEGWEAKLWSYDSCEPPANRYPIMGAGRPPTPAKNLKSWSPSTLRSWIFPTAMLPMFSILSSDSGKDVVFLFGRDGALAKKSLNETTVRATTFRVRATHERWGRLFKYVVYPITGSGTTLPPGRYRSVT